MKNILKTTLATNKDLNILNEIQRESKSHWGYDENFLDEYMRLVKYQESCFEIYKIYLVKSDKTIIGFYSFMSLENKVAELHKFFLKPNFIGKGYGKMLWNNMVNTAKELSYAELEIHSDPNAIGFYQSMGCILTSEKFIDGQVKGVLIYKV